MHISCFLSGTFDKGLSQRRMNLQPGGPRGPRNRGWGLPQAPVIHLTSCMCDPPPSPKALTQGLGSPSGSLLAWKVWDL